MQTARSISDQKSPIETVTKMFGQPRAVHDSFGHPRLRCMMFGKFQKSTKG